MFAHVIFFTCHIASPFSSDQVWHFLAFILWHAVWGSVTLSISFKTDLSELIIAYQPSPASAQASGMSGRNSPVDRESQDVTGCHRLVARR